jgi:hypothetical protein
MASIILLEKHRRIFNVCSASPRYLRLQQPRTVIVGTVIIKQLYPGRNSCFRDKENTPVGVQLPGDAIGAGWGCIIDEADETRTARSACIDHEVQAPGCVHGPGRVTQRSLANRARVFADHAVPGNVLRAEHAKAGTENARVAHDDSTGSDRQWLMQRGFVYIAIRCKCFVVVTGVHRRHRLYKKHNTHTHIRDEQTLVGAFRTHKARGSKG